MSLNEDTLVSTVPVEIYRSFVRSVFDDHQMMFVGVISSLFVVGVTYRSTGLPLIAALAFFIFVVGLGRVWLVKKFKAVTDFADDDDIEYEKWEKHFFLGACLYVILFGVWCLVSALSGDQFAIFASVSTTLANLVGVCGRCFPLKRLVSTQLLLISIPLVTGMFLLGGYYQAMAVLLVPFFYAINSIANKQRWNLLQNTVNRLRADQTANRLEMTFENMPHGICMFDARGCLEIANGHINRFIGREPDDIVGKSVFEFASILQYEAGLSRQSATEILNWVREGQGRNFQSDLEMGREDRTNLKFRATKLNCGGFITSFEDTTWETNVASKIDKLTRYDTLTGLLNRTELTRHLEQVAKLRRARDGYSILLLNIGEFKSLNDKLGHRLCDRLLSAYAERLSLQVGSQAVCGRFSGNEFAVVINGSKSSDIAQHLADTLCDVLREPFEIEAQSVVVVTTVGIASATPNYHDAETLLNCATIALAAAKQDNIGSWQMFTGEMGQELDQRLQLESDLSQALVNGQFELFYQPIVSITKNKVSVCEALLRWCHPTHGMISPAQFIPMLERLGLIEEVGDWVIRQAVHQCTMWPSDVGVAVNLSALQFADDSILKTVSTSLTESGLQPSRLELEVTESLLLENVDRTVTILNKLRKKGVRVSLDDFGTGYSSLSYMNSLPLNKVKIDRSFVNNIVTDEKSRTLVQAITALGQNLGLKVVVEGVETREQLDLLLKVAPVDQIQGYYFSRPVASSDLLKLLDKRSLEHRRLLSIMPFDTARVA